MDLRVTYGMFRTCVGKAETWLSSMPKLFSTLSPVGKSWKKFGTPEATYAGIPEPSWERMFPTSCLTSLKMSRFKSSLVLVGSHVDGDGVIKASSSTVGAGRSAMGLITDAVTSWKVKRREHGMVNIFEP